ncbi:protein SPT2 homolog [Pelodytes ibericus]
MDFHSILKAAATKQAEGGTKRYSLAVGPPKKDPKVKGVHSAAVQAFLKKKEEEIRKKELEEKLRKEDLLAKRKELKHDKKARAMASRTKDNFRGYNGIPVEDKPKKRRSSPDRDPNASFRSDEDQMTEEELYEYSQTESEQEEIEESAPPPKKMPKMSNVKKAAPPAMNFADLLRLAEKKQFEPVEIVKPMKKSDDRPRTAEEIRELEFLEKKTYKADKKSAERDYKTNGQVVKVTKSSGERPSPSSKGNHSVGGKPKTHKINSNMSSKSISNERGKSGHDGTIKKSSNDGGSRSEKTMSSSHSKIQKVSTHGNPKFSSAKEHDAKHSSSSRLESMGPSSGSNSGSVRPSSGSNSGSVRPSSGSNSGSVRPSSGSNSGSVRPSSGSNSGSVRPSSGSNSGSVRPSSGSNSGSVRPSSGSNSGSVRPSSGSNSGSVRPSSGSNSGSVRPLSGSNSGSVRPSSGSVRPSSGSSSVQPSGTSGSSRPSSGGHTSSGSRRSPSVPGSRPNGGPPTPGNTPKSAPSRPGPASSSMRPSNGSAPTSGRMSGGSGPGRPVSNSAVGQGASGKPKCTVVSETISFKNFIPKSNNGQMNGMRAAPPPGGRPMVRPPGPPKPPITISYKRRIEDEEEYDSEMEDFIDDGGDCQDEISKHIREIFGYDKNKYKDESDYALRYMESSFREQQKEEARSLRLGIQEDLEELRREEEELKRKAKQERAAKKMKSR